MAEDSLTARNRINQRNFRARRQNYIKDLEERLRKYETEGVQATIEIQTAARQVTEQNVKLRNLLTSSFGMNDPEIDAYLGTNNQSLSSIIFPTPPPSTLAVKLYPDSRNSSLQSIAPYPEPNSQTTSQQSILSPALGLASLCKLPEQSFSTEFQPPSKKPKRDLASHMSISSLTTPDHPPRYTNESHDSPNPELEQDTLSESSNPQTPAEQLDPLIRNHTNNIKPFIHKSTTDDYLSHHTTSHLPQIAKSQPLPQSQPQSQKWTFPLQNSTPSTTTTTITPSLQQSKQYQSPLPHRRPDETSCEDAARIIASMRRCPDEDRPENILLELGCRVSSETGKLEDMSGRSTTSITSPTQMCNVKNLNIFKLMDEMRQ